MLHTTNNDEAAAVFRDEVLQTFPGNESYMDHLSLSVACHIGQGGSGRYLYYQNH